MRAGLLCLLVALLPLSACGDDAVFFEEIAAAAEATKEAGTARVSLSGTTTNEKTGELELEGEGEIDFENERGRISMEMSGAPGIEGTTDVLFDGLILYMKSPALGEIGAGIRPWIKIDLQAVGEEELGIDFSALNQMGGSDPTQSLEWLEGAEEVEELGIEEVRGVSTTHYKGVLDFERLAEEGPEDARASMENLLDLLGETTVPFELWLDDQGRMRRMYQEIVTDQPGAGEVRQVQTVEMFDFGAPVDIDFPPPNQVTDFREFLESLTP